MAPGTLLNDESIPVLKKSTSTALEGLVARNPKILFVRFQWQDLSGILRTRVLPLEHALAIAAGRRSLSVPPIALNSIIDGSLVGDVDPNLLHSLEPDWSSLVTRRLLDPLYATVMCRVLEHSRARALPQPDICPRLALESVIGKAKDLLHAYFLVGFEVEFEVVKVSDNGQILPYSNGLGHLAMAGMRDPTYKHVEEAIQVMLDAGVKIDAFQTEGYRGQYEITLGPLSPIQAVDQLILVHDILKQVFGSHGLIATMAPRPVTTRRQSNGQHAHISINPPLMEERFLAGILQRLPELCSFLLPYELSYERLGPYMAGHIVAWGTENRTVPIRKISPGHWEVRCADATANMYLGLAAIISAGLAGCIKEEPLIWPDSGLLKAGSEPSKAVRLPGSIEEALKLIQENHEELEAIMDSKVIQHYIEVKRFEAFTLRDMGAEKIRELLAEMF